MAEVVLDASALLARIWREPGFEKVEAAITGALISAVNMAEVVQKLVDRGVPTVTMLDIMSALPCRTEVFDAELAFTSGLLRRETRQKGLSLGDRACLALAMLHHAPVLTADRAWAELDLDVEVVLIR